MTTQKVPMTTPKSGKKTTKYTKRKGGGEMNERPRKFDGTKTEFSSYAFRLVSSFSCNSCIAWFFVLLGSVAQLARLRFFGLPFPPVLDLPKTVRRGVAISIDA